MKVEKLSTGNLQIEVPFTLGFIMVWDTFKCELKSARVCGPTTDLGRRSLRNARHAAKLLIGVVGKESAISSLRTISRSVAMEVAR